METILTLILRLFQSIKEEDNEYASVKNDLRVQIRDMRRTVSL